MEKFENRKVVKGDNRDVAIAKTKETAAVGAGAGIGVAALVGAPVAICGLIGGGLACLGAGIFSLFDDEK